MFVAERSLSISSHVNLVFVRYFDEMYVNVDYMTLHHYLGLEEGIGK